ncbi:substrate-binding domain-containing protein [Mangrovicoccus sp. HB161399]|uniref:substrate-binding domain-containing protein n=1 Tax=Mangrovicoccus sp. HB161399 TaxID=2720392 RepID=UPI001556EC08|nr:substrate-binding domain-containing protein [Mangrovicoccus sp. HB161399]
MPFQRLAAALIWIATLASAGPMAAADIFVIGGKPDDPFWSIVRRGVEDAQLVVDAQLGSVTWLGLEDYDRLGADAAALIREAISRHADGIVAPDWDPGSMDPAFEEAAAAGIPLVIYNAGGIAAAKRLGALTYVGSDNFASGREAGLYFGEQGFVEVVCVNTLPGLANIADMCGGLEAGLADAGGRGMTLVLPEGSFGVQDVVSDAIKAHLLENPGVSGILAIGNQDVVAARDAVARAGKAGRVKVGGINLDETTMDNIRSGTQLFAIDQQGYLQGFFAVTILNAHVNFGLTVPRREILTGPGMVDLGNIDIVQRGIRRGAR